MVKEIMFLQIVLFEQSIPSFVFEGLSQIEDPEDDE